MSQESRVEETLLRNENKHANIQPTEPPTADTIRLADLWATCETTDKARVNSHQTHQ